MYQMNLNLMMLNYNKHIHIVTLDVSKLNLMMLNHYNYKTYTHIVTLDVSNELK